MNNDYEELVYQEKREKSKKEFEEIIALSQLVQESGNRIKAVKNISFLLDIPYQESALLIEWLELGHYIKF